MSATTVISQLFPTASLVQTHNGAHGVPEPDTRNVKITNTCNRGRQVVDLSLPQLALERAKWWYNHTAGLKAVFLHTSKTISGARLLIHLLAPLFSAHALAPFVWLLRSFGYFMPGTRLGVALVLCFCVHRSSGLCRNR